MIDRDEGRRSSVRVKARLKVRFKNAHTFISEYTHNISKGGLFIRTTKPCNLRDKLEVVLVLPESEEEIVALGEVIHIVPVEEATDKTPAGMGLQLIELKLDDQKKIEEYINKRLRTDGGVDYRGRREHQRFETRIKVRFESREALLDEYVHNISHGGIFIATSKPKQLNEVLSLVLIHPETGQEMMLEGEVVRVVSEEEAKRTGQKQGMGIRFLNIDHFVRKQLEEFIASESERQKGKGLIVEES